MNDHRVQCEHILGKGKNVGQQCKKKHNGVNETIDGKYYCPRHFIKYYTEFQQRQSSMDSVSNVERNRQVSDNRNDSVIDINIDPNEYNVYTKPPDGLVDYTEEFGIANEKPSYLNRLIAENKEVPQGMEDSDNQIDVENIDHIKEKILSSDKVEFYIDDVLLTEENIYDYTDEEIKVCFQQTMKKISDQITAKMHGKEFISDMLFNVHYTMTELVEVLGDLSLGKMHEKEITSCRYSLKGYTERVHQREDDLKKILYLVYQEYADYIDYYLSPLTHLALFHFGAITSIVAEQTF
jgi:hypothetical protein